jgi:hypothetical protein
MYVYLFLFFCLSLHYSMFVSKFQTNLFESDATQRNQLNHIVLYVVQLQLTPGGVCRSLQKTTHFIAYSTRKKNFPGFLAFYYRGRKRMLVRGLVGINCSSKCKNDADFTNGNHTWYQQKKKRKTSKLFLPIHLFVFCKNNCKDRTTYHHLFSPVQPSTSVRLFLTCGDKLRYFCRSLLPNHKRLYEYCIQDNSSN